MAVQAACGGINTLITHTPPKCMDCCGPHFAHANMCPWKKGAGREAGGWRSPSPSMRCALAPSPPTNPPPELAASGEREVEEGYASAPEEAGGMEEKAAGTDRSWRTLFYFCFFSRRPGGKEVRGPTMTGYVGLWAG